MNDKNWLEYWVDPQTWEFRGDFEGIFSDFEDPWNCRERINSLERKVLRFFDKNSGIEVKGQS
jgi:hypothetical protein